MGVSPVRSGVSSEPGRRSARPADSCTTASRSGNLRARSSSPGTAHARRRLRTAGNARWRDEQTQNSPSASQTFRELREEGCYYVDKTAYIRRLLDEGKHYFLSRPRRFGKSLFLDTCKELFEGSEARFEGLAIHEHWDWSVHHPVVRLSFGSGSFTAPGDVQARVREQLAAIERRESVVSDCGTEAGASRVLAGSAA